MAEEECPKCPPEGLPAWMGTFADLMSLLMCFFVLLLSFSEMDVLKFKQIAGSMKFAFGVQNKIEVKDIPKGTSVVTRFLTSKPDLRRWSIQQQTNEMTQQMLEFQAGNEDSTGGRSNAASSVADNLNKRLHSHLHRLSKHRSVINGPTDEKWRSN